MNLKRSLIILLSVVCVIVSVSGLLLYNRHKDLQETSEWVNHTYDVISHAQGLYNNLEKFIALQRGYLLSGDPEFEKRYQQSSDELDQEIVVLNKLTIDNPVQQKNLQFISKNMSILHSLLKYSREEWKKMDDATSLAKITAVRETASVIRQHLDSFLAEEKLLLNRRQTTEKRQELSYFYTLFGVTVASLVIMLLANGLILGLSAKNQAATRNLSIAEMDLAKTRERLEMAMRGTSDGVFDWNLETGEVYFSPRFRTMLGYNEAELPNSIEVFKTLVHPEDVDRMLDTIQQYFNHETERYIQEFRIQHKDGSWRWHLARGAATFDKDNHALRLVGAHTDITEQKETEVRLRASNKELEEFTYIASHDLRSPLVNLKGFASELQYCLELIQDFVRKALKVVPEDNAAEISSIVEKDMPQALSFISSSVTKMEKLTRAILELSRVGRRKLEFEPLNITNIVENCLKALQHQLSTRHIDVMVHELPNATGDAVAIEQVFGNIIDNAIKYLHPNRQGKIEISGTQNVSETIYHIKDNGRGIREEDLKKVFEIFKRAGNNDHIPGEGMGMSYVQTILRRHGGMIWCTSTLGAGTDFYFTLPHHLKKENADV